MNRPLRCNGNALSVILNLDRQSAYLGSFRRSSRYCSSYRLDSTCFKRLECKKRVLRILDFRGFRGFHALDGRPPQREGRSYRETRRSCIDVGVSAISRRWAIGRRRRSAKSQPQVIATENGPAIDMAFTSQIKQPFWTKCLLSLLQLVAPVLSLSWYPIAFSNTQSGCYPASNRLRKSAIEPSYIGGLYSKASYRGEEVIQTFLSFQLANAINAAPARNGRQQQ